MSTTPKITHEGDTFEYIESHLNDGLVYGMVDITSFGGFLPALKTSMSASDVRQSCAQQLREWASKFTDLAQQIEDMPDAP